MPTFKKSLPVNDKLGLGRNAAVTEPADHLLEINQGRWRAAKQTVFSQNRFSTCWRILERLARGEFWRVFARFYLFRRMHAALRRCLVRSMPNSQCVTAPLREPSIFTSLSIDEAVQKIREDGFYPNLCLPAALHEEIRDFAECKQCVRWGFDDAREERFYIHEALTGELPDGRLVGVADVDAPSSCPAIEQVARDPAILGLFRKCYGFGPTRISKRLFWNLRLNSAHPAMAFLPNRGSKFHYDVEGLNGLYIFFYLTHVDRMSGAHALIPGSHRKKKLAAQFGSRYFSDVTVHSWYGECTEFIVEGSAGYGFVEDPTCIHKIYVPSERNRLALQLRYF